MPATLPVVPQILTVKFPDDLLLRIDDFRYAHRFPTRSEAIRHLIEIGLQHAPAEGPKKAKPGRRAKGEKGE